MRILGGVLIVTGILMILGVAGQGDYEQFAMTHGGIVRTVPFKIQLLTTLAGIGGVLIGLSILRDEKRKRRRNYDIYGNL